MNLNETERVKIKKAVQINRRVKLPAAFQLTSKRIYEKVPFFLFKTNTHYREHPQHARKRSVNTNVELCS